MEEIILWLLLAVDLIIEFIKSFEPEPTVIDGQVMLGAWIPAAIAAAGVIGGSLLGGKSAEKSTQIQTDAASANSAAAIASQEKINEQNIAWAKQQQQWTEQMSNSAFQRQLADMKAAGLNPMLAAKNAGGASTPPAIQAPILGNPALAGAQAYGNIAQGASSLANAASTRFGAVKDVGKIIADTYKTWEDTNKTKSEINKIKEEIKSIPVARGLTEAQTGIISSQVAKIKAEINLMAAKQAESYANTGLATRRTEGVYYDNAKKELIANFLYSGEISKLSSQLGSKISVEKIMSILEKVINFDVNEFLPSFGKPNKPSHYSDEQPRIWDKNYKSKMKTYDYIQSLKD
ncbi:MAG: DNA pilot protein [Microviridae sp.]|nr:MAG: DNA pilot protein [Microviridae sp.]